MASDFLKEMLTSLGGDKPADEASVSLAGVGELPSYFDVTGLATAAIGAAGLEIARLSCATGEAPPRVQVDRRLASLWFAWSIRPQGWEVPSAWDEPGVIPEVTLGKRCAGLDLKDRADRAIFEKLLERADVLLHGYRADALPGLGYDDKTLRTFNPALIDISLNAYGWAGEWQNRRGFDSLVQMSCGIADHGRKESASDRPRPLPVQALDHATGYLLAAAVVSALRQRRERRDGCTGREGVVRSAKLSLARVAHLLCQRRTTLGAGFAASNGADLDPRIENSDWGPVKRVRWPLQIDGIEAGWPQPATRLRSAPAVWVT